MIVFLNDKFIKASDMALSPMDRGFTLGDGVFDTLLARNGRLIYGQDHFARLLDHAKVLRIAPSKSATELEAAALSLLSQNGFMKGDYAIRTTLTRGVGARGLMPPQNPSPTIVMNAAAAPDPSKAEPVQLIIAQGVRRNDLSPLSQVKSLNYADNLMALMEAKDSGAHDALLLNTQGHVACATTSNIFVLEKDTLLTPSLTCGVMNGVMRRIVMEKTGAREDVITPERLRKADGIYLTNSILGIRPVARLDGRDVPSLNPFYNRMISFCAVKEAA